MLGLLGGKVKIYHLPVLQIVIETCGANWHHTRPAGNAPLRERRVPLVSLEQFLGASTPNTLHTTNIFALEHSPYPNKDRIVSRVPLFYGVFFE